MKFYHRKNIDPHNPSDNSWAVESDGRIVTTSEASLELPSGPTSSRPSEPEFGTVRYNESIAEMEGYFRNYGNAPDGSGRIWERIRTVRPARLTVQNLGSGNYSSNIFGPLDSDYRPSYLRGAANVQLYVDNVFQIPFTNYDLIVDPAPVVAATTATTTGSSLLLDSVLNITPGQTITGSPLIPEGTTVVSQTTSSNEVIMSNPVSSPLPSGINLTFTFNTGTYIQFSGPVPAKPVVAILGLDGYFPPGI